MTGRARRLAAGLVAIVLLGCLAVSGGANSRSELTAPPDIHGPGQVLRVGNVFMKVTNAGILGNPFTNLSTDPSAMWPGSSGVEYLNHIALAVGAKDATAAPDVPVHRVSYATEWSPATSEPEDRIYRTWETQINGTRLVNDDGDFDPVSGAPRIDEDFLDGRDNDGDGLIDEDFAAIGHETFTCVMRDDGAYSPQSGHVPLGLEVRQMAWGYGTSGFEDFNAIHYAIINRSGHALDSVYVGFKVDMDAGPIQSAQFFADDRDLPGYPSGEFVRVLAADELQRQLPHDPGTGVPADSALCPRVVVRVNGFSLADGDGDAGQTPGVATFLLLDHTRDPLGLKAPTRVGFRAFRSFLNGTPFSAGGNPTNDSLRYLFLSGAENIDPTTGFIDAAPGAQDGDYAEWCSIGPFLDLADGAEIEVTIAFAVHPGTVAAGFQYPADYAAYVAGTMSGAALLAAHPPLANAHGVQRARDGTYELIDGPRAPDFHGRETPLRQPLGAPPIFAADCRSPSPRIVTDRTETWFDFDCDYCSGAWDFPTRRGLVHRVWNVSTYPLDVGSAATSPAVGPRILAIAPNPGGGAVRISFELPHAGLAEVSVYDLGGRIVRSEFLGLLPSGRHDASWDGRGARGRPVPPGVYLWKVRVGGQEATQKVVRSE